MEKCGCSTKTNADFRGRRGADKIIFCPLHASAGKMLEALHRICRYSLANCNPGRKIAKMVEIAHSAILKAQ